ncbi:MAG: leucine-rich repeat domain-containing protein [Bacteroidaceae bacterium]|nr:leucine-rich repeat domain-containing protein [Bacteroidaceae bacterium]
MKKLKKTFLLLTLTWAMPVMGIERDTDGYYLIGTTADYEEFCDLVNSGDCYASARVTADGITVTRSIGVGERQFHFRGKFDGQGHTLIINNVPMFEHTQPGCVISNVNLTGHLSAEGEYAGALIGEAMSPTIENCSSEVVIEATDECKAGGLVGYSRGAISLNNCSFTGQIAGTRESAALIGWSQHSATIKNCRAAGTKYLAGNLVEGAHLVENTLLNEANVAMTIKINETAEVTDSIHRAMKAKHKAFSLSTATIDGIYYGLQSDGVNNLASVGNVSSNLTSVKIPSTVEWNGETYTVYSIGGMDGGRNMQYLEVPASVEVINNNAFEKCTNLSTVIFADGDKVLDLGYNVHTFIDEQLFEYCPITWAYIGRNLSWNKGEDEPFETRNKLELIEFGPRVTVVGNYNYGDGGRSELFDGCNQVKEYYFYGNDESVNTEVAFYCCQGMSKSPYAYIDRNLQASKYTEYSIAGSTTGISDKLQSVTYGPHATYITARMYSGIAATPNYLLSSVNLRNATRLATIKERAFADCDKLEQIDLLNTNVRSIETEGFYDCDKLKDVTFSPVLEEIGRNAFDDTGLINIVIPGTITRLGHKAFYDCDKAVSLTFNPGSEDLWCDMDGSECSTFTSCGSLTNLYLGRNIRWKDQTQLKGSPFYDSYFTNIVIDDNVSLLGNYLFQRSNKLKSVSIGKGVKLIPNECFADATEVTSFLLADTDQAITLGKSVENLKVSSFYMGRPINDVAHIPGRVHKTLSTLQVGPSVPEVKAMSFWTGCDNLRTVTLPANIRVEGLAFSSCGIEDLYVQGDAYLETSAFHDCNALQDITVVGKLTMEESAFKYTFEGVAPRSLSVFFREDPKDESHAQALPNAWLETTTLNNMYDTPYQQVDFSCLPWSGFGRRNTLTANDYAPSSEAMADGMYDHAYMQSQHEADKFFTAYLPFDLSTYYFGADATAYSLAADSFSSSEQDGEFTLSTVNQYNLDDKLYFDRLMPFIIKSKYEDGIVKASIDQFKSRQVEVKFNGTEGAQTHVPCYVSNQNQELNPAMGNLYVVDNGCLKKVNGNYTLPALSVALNAGEYNRLHLVDSNTGTPLMPEEALVTPQADLMGYVTFYSSESSFSVEGADVYTLTQTTDNEGQELLKLEPVTDHVVSQSHAVLIKYVPGETLRMQMVTTPSTCAEAYAANVLKGVDVDTPVSQLGSIYVLSKLESVVGFYPYAGTGEEAILPAHCAYIDPTGMDPKSLPVVVDFTHTTVIDGSLVSDQQSHIYDLSGRKQVSKPKSGLYIDNEQKIIYNQK